jgi:hypothetical protein
MDNHQMQAAIKELQDAMVVMAHLEKHQTEILKQHARMIEKHDLLLEETQEFRRRTDQNLAEITDKLNGLIGYVAGERPDSGPKP